VLSRPPGTFGLRAHATLLEGGDEEQDTGATEEKEWLRLYRFYAEIIIYHEKIYWFTPPPSRMDVPAGLREEPKVQGGSVIPGGQAHHAPRLAAPALAVAHRFAPRPLTDPTGKVILERACVVDVDPSESGDEAGDGAETESDEY
jgi:hypothetical protein